MLGYISHANCLLHDAGPLNPDTPDRLNAISDQLIMSRLDYVLRRYDAPEATPAQLELAHDRDYIAKIFNLAPTDTPVEIDGDTMMSPGTLKAALHAAGAGIMGIDLIMRGEANPVFCAVRPPGHHATRDTAMGFCLFNNIAIAAFHALETYGLDRVAIVDFDVHHGNGTEDIVNDDPRILFCSLFQHPFYPFTGHENYASNLVSIPLKAGTDSLAYRETTTKNLIPALDQFKPQLLLVSAGFDAHLLDDMSDVELWEADYEWLGQQLLRVASDHCEGRMLSMLEGGYDVGSLARSVMVYINATLE